VFRAAALGGALYIGIAFLGAITVFLDLSAWVVVLHLGAALALIATLIGTAYAAGSTKPEPAPKGTRRAAVGALGLGAMVVVLGGLTANLGAAGSCVGFPLCSGSVWPSGVLAWLQWVHRLAAYALVLHMMGLIAASRRRGGPAHVTGAATAALVVMLAQVAVAAVMVLGHLPPIWRGLHAAVGIAVWVALVRLERETVQR
jgi:heme A synthase